MSRHPHLSLVTLITEPVDYTPTPVPATSFIPTLDGEPLLPAPGGGVTRYERKPLWARIREEAVTVGLVVAAAATGMYALIGAIQ